MCKVLNNKTEGEEIRTEQVKHIALDLFYSIYVKKDIGAVMKNVDENIQWIGTTSDFKAHSKEELQEFMEKELKGVSLEYVIEMISLEATKIDQNVYSVMGELLIHTASNSKSSCNTCRFMLGVSYKENHILIKSVHTFMMDTPVIQVEGIPDIKSKELTNGEKGEKIYDLLTGFYNLNYFKSMLRDFLDQEQLSSPNYALFCTDISNFEKLNNVYGLQEADCVLVELGTLLIEFSHKVIYCCRSVADHFLVLLKCDNEKKIRKEISGLCKQFDESVSRRYKEAGLKLGVGVYMIQDHTLHVDKMVDYANLARKNLRYINHTRVAFCDSKLSARFEKVKKIERAMEKALDEEEFKVFIQPKYDLITEKIVGAEALVRWIRPDGTVVYPDEFIPIFEKNGFIQKLDFYMLKQVCKIIQQRLIEKKICVHISVNQSRYLLKDIGYSEQIANLLSEYNTPPELIELELTERLFTDRIAEMAQVMKNLKKIGIRWSIDDFGTGYSSLNLLKELPVDIIKIDKAFLDESETSSTSRVIIRKTVELTRELDKTVVCEGVETEEQAQYLREINCDFAQGFLYAKPMMASEFENLLDSVKV